MGVGYAIQQSGGAVTLESRSLRRQRISLDFVASRVLSENEAALKKLEMVASDSSLLLFDAPALMHRLGRHQEYRVRHLVWIDPEGGGLGMLEWLMPAGRTWRDLLRLIFVGFPQERVRTDVFTWMVRPSCSDSDGLSFALEDISPGRNYDIAEGCRALMGLDAYSVEELNRLRHALQQCMLEARVSEPKGSAEPRIGGTQGYLGSSEGSAFNRVAYGSKL